MSDSSYGVYNELKKNSDAKLYLFRDQFSAKNTLSSPIIQSTLSLCLELIKQKALGAATTLKNAGFGFTDSSNTGIRCDDCGLELPDCKTNTDLLTFHKTARPDCLFVRNKQSTKISTSPSSFLPIAVVRNTSIENDLESPLKRQKIEASKENINFSRLFEPTIVQQIRRRTFSHWPHRASPSQAQMIEAGFFNCNVGDRVICIYCNLICQQWSPNNDDPCEVHKTLRPNCIYVKAKLIRHEPGSILIVNDSVTGASPNNQSIPSNSVDQFRCNEFVHTAACHTAYTELYKRTASFATWPTDNLPSVDDLVRAGFFFSGTKTIVTCFYCNGSLQNWGANDNPTIEHARWFPQCAYAKQLCGDDLYRKIQESKRAQQERARVNQSREAVGSSASTNSTTASNSRQLLIPDESTLSRLVAARLDLPISQSLLKEFKLSIIKRCWEDQLRLKRDDFVTDSDLRMACKILQKQIEHIDGKKENIVIPSVQMKKIQEDAEKQRAEALAREQITMIPTVPLTTPLTSNNSPQTVDVEMTTSSQSATNDLITQEITIRDQKEADIIKPTISDTNQQNQTKESPIANPCVLCLSEEKRLACIPCGHLATCVPCGHSLRSCPICRREIEAFVRIYI
ncbi:unnamed protein product [Adineta steineri]|uniref:RING-type domain-containing protein n=1 Tax=Adineta steineri TaxID=433720 RepID=A0A814U6R9_9BILA|nr:unnamed protein product [Adineta steineri]CAF1170340.1 unnamed protein product [Adineta steineri]